MKLIRQPSSINIHLFITHKRRPDSIGPPYQGRKKHFNYSVNYRCSKTSVLIHLYDPKVQVINFNTNQGKFQVSITKIKLSIYFGLLGHLQELHEKLLCYITHLEFSLISIRSYLLSTRNVQIYLSNWELQKPIRRNPLHNSHNT